MEVKKTVANFSTKHPVVDVEISNDIEIHRWDYSKGEISVAGFFVDNEIIQFMLKNKSNLNKFQKEIMEMLTTLDGRKLHAFNIRMETGCFSNLLGNSPQFHEIMPFSGRGSNKEYHFK